MAAPEGYTTATMKDFIGHDFGTSAPVEINQIRINTFADCTGGTVMVIVRVVPMNGATLELGGGIGQ